MTDAAREQAIESVKRYVREKLGREIADREARELISFVREIDPTTSASSSVGSVPSTHRASTGLRIGAVAGVLSNVFLLAAAVLDPRITDALNPADLPAGLKELAAHPTVGTFSAQSYVLSDITLIVFLVALAAIAKGPGRSVAWLGASLAALNGALDLVLNAVLIAVTRFVAPQAVIDPAMRAVGIAMLGFGATIDVWQSLLGPIGFALLGLAAWRGGYWPKWVAGMAIANGAVLFVDRVPSLAQWLGTFYVEQVFTAAWTTALCVLLWQVAARDQNLRPHHEFG